MSKGTIYQRKDGRWECRISLGKDENGKRKFRSFYGKTREEAEYRMMISQQNTDDVYAVTEMTVRELVTEWIYVQSARLKESTAANYRMKAEKHIIPAFGDIQCCLLKAKDVYAFVERKLKDGLSARYLTDIIVLLKSVFRYASREYHIKNVLDGIVMPKRSKAEINVLSKEQQEKLERFIGNHANLGTLGVLLSMYMGLRVGEICALQWEDIDIEKRTLNVRKTIQRVQCFTGEKKTRLTITEPKSNCSKREIPIPECLVPMLNKFKSRNSIYVVSGTRKPIEPRTMQYRFAKLLNNAELPSVHFHSLRHLFATNCIKLGFDVKTLSEILGHSSIEITMNLYVHSDMERKRACMSLLLQKIRSGDRTAKNRLVEMYLRNALSIALEAAEVSSLSLEDIFSETVIGLMERLNCPTENKNYSAFLSKGMRFAAYNYVQKNEVKFMSYKDYCESIKGKYYDGESVMIKHICHIQLQQLLDSAVTTLTDREQRILNLRFGLRNSDKRSYKEIAEMYYIDKNRVRQIERKLTVQEKHAVAVAMIDVVLVSDETGIEIKFSV